MPRRCLAAWVLWLALNAPPALLAETFFMVDPPARKPTVHLRFLHPRLTERFAGGRVGDLSAFSGAYDVTAQLPFDRANVMVSVPWSSVHAEPRSSGRLGNLSVGVQTRGKGVRAGGVESLSFGVVLPTGSEAKKTVYTPIRRVLIDSTYVNSVGAAANPYDEQRFLVGVLTIYANMAYRWSWDRGLAAAFEVGPDILIPIDGGDTEGRLHYAIAGGAALRRLAFRLELLGLVSRRREPSGSEDPFVHFLALGARLTGWPVEPAVFYELPLEGRGERDLDGVLGVKLAYPPP